MLILRILLLHPPVHITGLSHGRIPVQLHLRPREEPVDLFEGEVARLGVEEVDQREEAEIEHWDEPLAVSLCYLYRGLLVNI